VSTAVRVGLLLAAVAVVLALVLGPAWRGGFYRSWLRPRLVVFGVIVALLAAGEYLFRVINAIKSHS
jgi:type IV secretory pathway VirB2 component (pilin)